MDKDNYEQTINILNLALTKDFLSKELFLDLIYEILINRKTFNLCILNNWYLDKSDLKKNIDLLFNYYKQAEYFNKEEIIGIITNNFEQLKFEVVSLLPIERYIENPNHIQFVNHIMKIYISHLQQKVKESL